MLREYISTDVFTLLLLLCLFLVVGVRQLYVSRFNYYIQVIWNVRYLKFYSRNRKGLDVFSTLLFLNFLIAISISLYIGYNEYAGSLHDKNNVLPYMIAGIGAFIVLKSVLERLVGYFFEIPKVVGLYLFQKLTFNNYVGLVLIGINVLLLFSELNKNLLLYLAFIVFVTINLIGFVRILRLYQKRIIANFFYFLLYLCALEIGPYVILYKVIKDYFG